MRISALRLFGLAACSALVVAAAGCNIDLQQVFVEGSGNSSASGGSGGQGGTGGATSSGGSDTTSSSTGTMTETATNTTTSTTTTTTTTTDTKSDTIGCDNGQTCQIDSEICCWDKWGSTGSFESGQCLDAPVSPFDCNTEVQQGGVHTVISCQTKDNCPGTQLCCGDVVQFQSSGGTISYYPVIECRNTCDLPTRILCTGAGDPVCPSGTTCKPSQLLPDGYQICSPN